MRTASRGTLHDLTPHDIRIESVPGAARDQALAFLLEDTASSPAAGGDEFLVWARAGERLSGAAWAHATSRMTVTIVPPRLARRVPADVGQRLLALLLDQVARRSGTARCAVALVDEEAEGDAKRVGAQTQWLRRAGFEQVATVEFLLARGVASELSSPLALRRAGQHEAEQFAQTLRMTTADVAGGVDAADRSAWVRWRQAAGLDLDEDDVETNGAGECYFVQHAARVVGVLVLAPARPEDNVCEIRYLGIVPAERRRGYAVATLGALKQLAERQGRQVTASVDSAQTAAVRAYRRAGFRPWRRRRLWAKRIDPA